MSDDPSLVLEHLRAIRAEVADIKAVMATKSDIAEVRSEMKSLRADVASDLMTTEKRLGEQITGLRRAVIEYHSAVIGHGVLISDLDARLRRIEQHLNLPSPDAH